MLCFSVEKNCVEYQNFIFSKDFYKKLKIIPLALKKEFSSRRFIPDFIPCLVLTGSCADSVFGPGLENTEFSKSLCNQPRLKVVVH